MVQGDGLLLLSKYITTVMCLMPGVTKPTCVSGPDKCWKPACNGPMCLILDVHRAQKTEAVQEIF